MIVTTRPRHPRPAGCRRPLRRAALAVARAALLALLALPALAQSPAPAAPPVVPSPPAEEPAATPPAPPPLPDGEHGPYTGRLAGQPIVALFTVEGGAVRGGRFFYRFHGRDISLVPAGDGFVECPYQLHRYDEPCESPSGRWTLVLDADGARGEWRAKAATPARPIELAPTRGGADPDDVYEAFRLADNRLVTIANRSSGAVGWKVVREARSGVTMPFVTRSASADAAARINAALERRFHREIGASLTAEDYHSAPTVLFANERLFAVGGSVDWSYRGAAHPSSAFVVQTFDLATGEAVDWSRRLRLVETDGQPFDVARRNVLAAPMLREVLRRARQRGDEGTCWRIVAERYGCRDGRCAPIEPEATSVWAMWPTTQGLAVAPDVYAEVERVCRGEAVIVPWDAVRATQREPGPLP